MEKAYLSRAQTRALGLDHPVGDPFGGPAFDERRDPVTAVVSLSTMAGTYAAAGSFAAMTLTSGLMFAGAAISLVGNVTGNKTLSKIGGIATLAGGVGALGEMAAGQSLGTLGESSIFGDAAKGVDAAIGGLKTAPAAGSLTPVVDGAAQVMPVADPAPANVRSIGSMDLSTPSVEIASPTASYAGGNLAPVTAPAAGAAEPPGLVERFSSGVKDFGKSAVEAGKGVMDFAKANPAGANVLAQAAGGVADWLTGRTDAEIAALEAQTGFADARALQIQEQIANEKRRRSNLNSGYQQVNTQIPVNPSVSIPVPWQQQQQPQGLIAAGMAQPRG